MFGSDLPVTGLNQGAMPYLQSSNGPLQSANVPQMQQGGGMFGAGGTGSKILRALSAFATNASAGLGNPAALQTLQGQQQQKMYQMELGKIGIEQQAQFQRELALQQSQAQLRMQYPEGEKMQVLLQAGYRPGTPEWAQALQTLANNEMDPVVMTPQGPMLRSAIVNAPQAGQQAPQGVTFTPLGPGGPTQPASGGFRP